MFDKKKLEQSAKKKEAENKALIKKLKKKKPTNLDTVFQELHEKAFDHIDCLECANCCSSLGPRITDKDIERLAKHFRKKPSEIVDEYFRIDEDGDYVFQSMPCPFLGDDNYCFVYEVRPKACREYPHTDQVKIQKVLNIMVKNSFTCPAVYEVLEEIKTMK